MSVAKLVPQALSPGSLSGSKANVASAGAASQLSGGTASLSSFSKLCGLCLTAISLPKSKSRSRRGPIVRAQEGGRNATVVRGSEAPEKPAKLRLGQGGNIVESQHGAFVVYPPTIPVKRRVGRSIVRPEPRQKPKESSKRTTIQGDDEERDAVFLESKESKLAEKAAKSRAREGYLKDEEEEAEVQSEGKDAAPGSLAAGESESAEEEPYFRGKADVRLDYDIRPVVERIRQEGLEVMALFVDKLGVRDMDRILLKFGARAEWQVALRVFEWMLKDRFLQPDQKTYTIMMDILGTNKQPRLAEEMFQSMQEEGLVDTRACNVLLNAYAQVGQAKQASALFGYMKEQRMRLDAYTYSSVIKALSRDRSRTDEVLALFQEMQAARIAPTSVIYSQMIETLGSAGFVDQAESVFKQMQRSGVAPELIAFNSLLAAYTKQGMISKVEAIFDDLKQAGFEPSKYTYATVINAYGNAGDLDSAERVFAEYLASPQVQEPGPHNALMGVYARRGDLTKALQVFAGMNERGASPNDVSAVIILSSLVRARKMNEAEQLYETIEALEISHSTQLWNAVIHMYGKAGKVGKAREAYATMQKEGFRPNEVTYRELAALDRLERGSAPMRAVNGTPVPRLEQRTLLEMVGKAVQEGNLREALVVLRAALKDTRAEFEVQAFNVFCRACERNNEWEPVEELWREMRQQGRQLPAMTYYAVLQVFAKSNQLPRAEAVFSEMRSKGMAKVANGYNMRMNGYGRVRDFEAMEGVFGEMQAAGVTPDEVTFNTLISHYARTQQFEAALDALERMRDAGLRPNDVTHGIFRRDCHVSPDQVQEALQRGSFQGIIPDDVYVRQKKGRGRPRRGSHVAVDTEGGAGMAGATPASGGFEESTSRTGAESLVEEQPSSSSATGEDEWLRTLLRSQEGPSVVYDTVRWTGPDPPLDASSLTERVRQLVEKEGPERKWKVASFNNLLYAYADNLHMKGALHIFDKMLERNVLLKKRSAMKLLENLARTQHTDDTIRVRDVCDKAGIASFIYVSEAVEREMNRAGRLSVQPR
ncbi:putative Pentatricopeptide repeat domain containing protein [Klebsormidium nitens]|uniref:Putative Pentatricopeptide repeat domain containing protein n=1 Tax=Klebsormidium nitens TaxID=105231 RepID=A0A1Y1HIA2_KLENI|nr:putative Pentatricopeptide repeat domain containing protein [Klebsormidium nitens]|eukprot:GAQ78210.1 putative Pentatricopeptide repeat domain containing protein [Klebsormidium nitens]